MKKKVSTIAANKRIENTVTDLRDLKLKQTELKSQISVLEDTVKEYMGDAEVLTNFRADAVIITWKNSEREQVDVKLLKEKYPKIYNSVKYFLSIRTLLVK